MSSQNRNSVRDRRGAVTVKPLLNGCRNTKIRHIAQREHEDVDDNVELVMNRKDRHMEGVSQKRSSG